MDTRCAHDTGLNAMSCLLDIDQGDCVGRHGGLQWVAELLLQSGASSLANGRLKAAGFRLTTRLNCWNLPESNKYEDRTENQPDPRGLP